MSSVKRRKVDENLPSGLLKENTKHKKAKTVKDVATEPAETSASSSPEPAPDASLAPTETTADEEAGGDKEAPKTFQDLVCTVFCVHDILLMRIRESSTNYATHVLPSGTKHLRLFKSNQYRSPSKIGI